MMLRRHERKLIESLEYFYIMMAIGWQAYIDELSMNPYIIKAMKQ